ncbi:MAG: hypothetical protein K6L75_01340 [Cellvibrionaceae bacterium]
MPSFQIDLYPSKIFLRVLIALHILVIVAIWLTAFSVVFSFILSIGIIFHLVWNTQKIKQSSRTIKSANGEWRLTRYGQNEIQELDMQPIGEAFIHRWLLVVVFKGKDLTKKKKETLLVFPDSTDTESFRRLRVALQYSK